MQVYAYVLTIVPCGTIKMVSPRECFARALTDVDVPMATRVTATRSRRPPLFSWEPTVNRRVLRAARLSPDVIDALINDECVAAVIGGYYPATLCERIRDNVARCRSVERYTHELHEEDGIRHEYFGVDRIGTPFNSTYSQYDKRSEYYRDTRIGIERLRDLCRPALSPIDKLRLELDETHRFGANVAAFEGEKMLAGIVRVANAAMSHMSAEEPHFDALPERYSVLDVQLAANVYISVPDDGGELEVWDVDPVVANFEAPAKWRAELGPPVRIQPMQGDLIIFSCRRPHAILPFEGDDRISCQMFIGHRAGDSLQLWN